MTRTNPDQLSVPPDGAPYSEQPQWRNDFPIDWPQDELVARRDFTKFWCSPAPRSPRLRVNFYPPQNETVHAEARRPRKHQR